LEFLARALRQEEEIRGTQTQKEKIKLSLFADDMILYVKYPKNSFPPKKTLTNHKHFQQSSSIQNQYTKISSFSTNNEQTKREIKKIIPFTIASNKIKLNT
jgi:hypothetical protein